MDEYMESKNFKLCVMQCLFSCKQYTLFIQDGVYHFIYPHIIMYIYCTFYMSESFRL